MTEIKEGNNTGAAKSRLMNHYGYTVEYAEAMVQRLPYGYRVLLAMDRTTRKNLMAKRHAVLTDCIRAQADFIDNPSEENWLALLAYSICYRHAKNFVQTTDE